MVHLVALSVGWQSKRILGWRNGQIKIMENIENGQNEKYWIIKNRQIEKMKKWTIIKMDEMDEIETKKKSDFGQDWKWCTNCNKWTKLKYG